MTWLATTTKQERITLTAAFGGYTLDAFDFMIYSFIIPTLIAAWSMSRAEAGLIATAALLSSAVGGWAAGVLADKYGRIKILQLTIVWFALFTFLSGFTNSFGQLMVTRTMQGLGFGGEWSVGSVLIAEMISAQHRGKAVGLSKVAGRLAGVEPLSHSRCSIRYWTPILHGAFCSGWASSPHFLWCSFVATSRNPLSSRRRAPK